MAIKTFTTGEVLTASDTNTFLANAGLVYIDGGSVSGQATLSKDGVFTTTYTNYRLTVTAIKLSTADRAVRINFRANGSTNTTNVYDYAYRGLRSNGNNGDTWNAAGTFAEVGVYISQFPDLELGSFTLDIMNPKATGRTFGHSNAMGYESGAFQARNGSLVYNGDTSFDGFHISLSGTGNISFNWRLYGYRQA